MKIQNEGRTTVDKKPTTLILRNARPRMRAGSAPPVTLQSSTKDDGWASGTTAAAAAATAPAFTASYPMHPPFAATPNIMGPYYPQYPQPVTNPIPFHAPPTTNMMPSNEKSPHDYPDIITWCQYLDSHKGRNQDGIIFTPFGAVLKNKGFVCITQLTSDFVTLRDLQEWLGIEVGTAILIMQYSKMDVRAIDEGRLFFPRRHNEST